MPVVYPHENWEQCCKNHSVKPDLEDYPYAVAATMVGVSPKRMKEKEGWENGRPVPPNHRNYTKTQIVEFSRSLIENRKGVFPPSERVTGSEDEPLVPPGLSFSLSEAAEHLRMSESKLQRHIARGDLKEVGGRIHVVAFAEFVKSHHGQIQALLAIIYDEFTFDEPDWVVVELPGTYEWLVVWAGEDGYLSS